MLHHLPIHKEQYDFGGFHCLQTKNIMVESKKFHIQVFISSIVRKVYKSTRLLKIYYTYSVQSNSTLTVFHPLHNKIYQNNQLSYKTFSG